ncbi:MAG: lipid-A-disaccharide synthase [Pseudomonadota bacterium]
MRVGLVAGELSGDALGAGLMLVLKHLHPEVHFEGIGGPQMRAAGLDCWHDYETLAVMGLTEVLRHLPRLLRLRRELVHRWHSSPPDVFVGIDSPDFNLGLAQRLRAQRIATVHYVSPSVWAWREKRVHKIARAVDRVLCLLPFEPAFYAKHDVAADFVGHPLARKIQKAVDVDAMRRTMGLDVAAPTLALLPGSRAGEVAKLADDFIETAVALQRKYSSLQVLIPAANKAREAQLRERLAQHPVIANLRLSVGDAQSCMQVADALLCASGTVTLEGMLHGKPMAVAYRLAESTFRLVRWFNLVRIANVSLPNLLTEEPLVPEFLQHDVNAEKLLPACERLLFDADVRDKMRTAFARVHAALAVDSDLLAARAVMQTVSQNTNPATPAG